MDHNIFKSGGTFWKQVNKTVIVDIYQQLLCCQLCIYHRLLDIIELYRPICPDFFSMVLSLMTDLVFWRTHKTSTAKAVVLLLVCLFFASEFCLLKKQDSPQFQLTLALLKSISGCCFLNMSNASSLVCSSLVGSPMANKGVSRNKEKRVKEY